MTLSCINNAQLRGWAAWIDPNSGNFLLFTGHGYVACHMVPEARKFLQAVEDCKGFIADKSYAGHQMYEVTGWVDRQRDNKGEFGSDIFVEAETIVPIPPLLPMNRVLLGGNIIKMTPQEVPMKSKDGKEQYVLDTGERAMQWRVVLTLQLRRNNPCVNLMFWGPHDEDSVSERLQKERWKTLINSMKGIPAEICDFVVEGEIVRRVDKEKNVFATILMKEIVSPAIPFTEEQRVELIAYQKAHPHTKAEPLLDPPKQQEEKPKTRTVQQKAPGLLSLGADILGSFVSGEANGLMQKIKETTDKASQKLNK